MRLFGRWKRAAVGVASVAAAMALATGCGKKAAASPDQRYKEAEQKQVKEFSESFLGAYDTSREKLASDKVASGEGTMTITVSDGAKQTLQALSGGTDFSWLTKLGMQMKAKVGKTALEENVALSLNDKPLGTLNLFMSDEALYMQIPELAEKFMKIPTDELGGRENFAKTFEQYKKMPEGKQLDKVITGYSKLITDEAKNVQESKEDVTVGNHTVNATKLEATFEGEQLTELQKKIVAAASDDQDLAAVVKGFVGDDGYAQFKDEIDKVKSNPTEIQGKLISTIWLGEGDKIVAREIRIENPNSNENYVFSMKAPNKGNEFASEVAFSEDGKELFNVSGSGSNDGKKMSGVFTFTQNGEQVGVLMLDELDLAAMKKGELTAKGKFKLAGGSSTSVMDLSAFSFGFDVAETEKSTKMTVTVNKDDNEFVTMALDSTRSEGGEEPTAPAEDASVDVSNNTEAENFVKGANWNGFLGQLRQTDIPSNYLDLMENSLKSAGYMQ